MSLSTARRAFSRLRDVEPDFAQERHRLERAEPDQLLVPRLEGERVEHAVQLRGMLDVQLRVQEELAEVQMRGRSSPSNVLRVG
jgi:hypothetical protein